MELLLGEGAYDEKTVKEAARALTGHGFNRVREFEFEVKPWRQDNGKNPSLGKEVTLMAMLWSTFSLNSRRPQGF